MICLTMIYDVDHAAGGAGRAPIEIKIRRGPTGGWVRTLISMGCPATGPAVGRARLL